MATITQKVIRRARRHYGVTVYTRKQWGTRHAALYRNRRRNRPVRVKRADTVVQHITVTRPSGNFKADARTVERIGVERFNSGVSYNFLVDMTTGEVAVGQPLDAKGTHTVNDKKVKGFSYDQNHAARAIAVVGMPDTPLSEKALDSIARLLAAMMDVGAVTPEPDYVPHSLFAWKDCPCDATRDAMPAIYRRAQEYRSGERPAQRQAAKKAAKKAPAKKAAKPNRVTKGRALIEDGLKLLRATPEKRTAVRKAADDIDAVLKRAPKR